MYITKLKLYHKVKNFRYNVNNGWLGYSRRELQASVAATSRYKPQADRRPVTSACRLPYVCALFRYPPSSISVKNIKSVQMTSE